MPLATHRKQQSLGGIAYLLTIDMSVITNNPTHVLRFTNEYGTDGTGVIYQGNQYVPYPYLLSGVKRDTKASKTSAKVQLADLEETITRFRRDVGGSLEGARIFEYKVFERFLDGGVEANVNAFSIKLDHLISHIGTSKKEGEVVINTIDPLSREIKVPRITFSAGIANDTTSFTNVFPAVERDINRDRND